MERLDDPEAGPCCPAGRRRAPGTHSTDPVEVGTLTNRVNAGARADPWAGGGAAAQRPAD